MKRAPFLFLAIGILFSSCLEFNCNFNGEPYIGLVTAGPNDRLDSVTVIVAADEPIYTHNLLSQTGNQVLIPMPMHYEEVDMTVFHGAEQSQVHFEYDIDVSYHDACGTEVRLQPEFVEVQGGFARGEFLTEHFSIDSLGIAFNEVEVTVINLTR